MDKKIFDYVGKYFNKTFYIPELNEERIDTTFIEILESGLNTLNLDKENVEKVTSTIKTNLKAVLKYNKVYIKNVRQLKAFKKVFIFNIKRLKRDIYIPDLIYLSLIESTNFELFDLIL